MLRSLFTGISGLTAHQQMLDVTANNIANVNTTGFKGSRAAFQDTLSQTLQGAAAGTTDTGGTNSKQIGLGVKLAGTELAMTQGGAQSTGVATDLMINGDGFFVVAKNGQPLYTRAGALHLDNLGQLVTPDGAIVQGFPDPLPASPLPAPTPLDLSPLMNGYTVATGTPITGDPSTTPRGDGAYVSYTIDAKGAINAVQKDGAIKVLGYIAMATFANPNGLEKVGSTEFQASASSGAINVGTPGDGSHGDISSGYLEMSNVDLSAELTNLIIAQRGFQANSKSVTTADQILQTLVTLKQ
jgi:flagellar hook protein FlgE